MRGQNRAAAEGQEIRQYFAYRRRALYVRDGDPGQICDFRRDRT